MADDLLNALNRKLVRYEQADMPEQVEAVKAKIAALTGPEDLSSLRKDELVAVAEQKGIETDGMTKAEVLEALEEG